MESYSVSVKHSSQLGSAEEAGICRTTARKLHLPVGVFSVALAMLTKDGLARKSSEGDIHLYLYIFRIFNFWSPRSKQTIVKTPSSS